MVFLVCLNIVSIICFGQTSFENYSIPNVGYISIPVNMEMQTRNYTIGENYQKEKFRFEVSDNRIVFQQKGISEDKQNELSTDARVILKTTIGNAGDFEKLTTRLSASKSELSKLSNQVKSQIEQPLLGTGVKIINWHGVKIVTVNGRTALNISYVRQLNDEPHVTVSIYQFNNNDRLHKLTLTYNEQEAATWQLLYSKILNTFTITNVR